MRGQDIKTFPDDPVPDHLFPPLFSRPPPPSFFRLVRKSSPATRLPDSLNSGPLVSLPLLVDPGASGVFCTAEEHQPFFFFPTEDSVRCGDLPRSLPGGFPYFPFPSFSSVYASRVPKFSGYLLTSKFLNAPLQLDPGLSTTQQSLIFVMMLFLSFLRLSRLNVSPFPFFPGAIPFGPHPRLKLIMVPLSFGPVLSLEETTFSPFIPFVFPPGLQFRVFPFKK